MLLGQGAHGSVYEEDGKAVKVYRDFPLIPPEAFNEFLVWKSLYPEVTLAHNPLCTYKLMERGSGKNYLFPPAKNCLVGKWCLTMPLFVTNILEYTRHMPYAQRYEWLVSQRDNFVRELEALHSRRWTHGDIKPLNILVNEKGDVFLCDFSFSNIESEDARYGCTEGFVAPECNVGLRHYYSDWWSLGCTCYYILYRTYYTIGCSKKLPSFVRQWLSITEVDRAPPSPRINFSHVYGPLEVQRKEISLVLDNIRDPDRPRVYALALVILCFVASHVTLELLYYPVAMEIATKHYFRQSLVSDVSGDYEEFRVIEEHILELLNYHIPFLGDSTPPSSPR